MSKTAHIVALENAQIAHWLGLNFGIRPLGDDHRDQLLFSSSAAVWVGARQKLETDHRFVQIIPYVVVRKGERYLVNIRSSAGGEGRLHGKLSIGFGGHMDFHDIVVTGDGEIHLGRSVESAAMRELYEELGFDLADYTTVENGTFLKWTHVIHTAQTAVDAVHLGLVAQLDLDDHGIEIDFSALENTIEHPAFITKAEIHSLTDSRNPTAPEVENWTKLVLGAA